MSSASLKKLEDKLETKNFVLGVIGLGYVGLPLSLTFLRKGVKVIGFDLDPVKIEKLAKGQSYIKHISSDELAEFTNNGRYIIGNFVSVEYENGLRKIS